MRTYLLDLDKKPSVAHIEQETLAQMANQLTEHAMLISQQAAQSSQHSIELGNIAQKMIDNSQQITQNAEQLVLQSRMISAVVSEIYRNRDEIRKLRSDMEKELSDLKSSFAEQNAEEYITPGQADILRDKIKEKAADGKTITIWRKLNRFFGISRYCHLPKNRFAEALQWINEYNS